MLTTAGLEWVTGLLNGALSDATLLVGDDAEQSASVPIESITIDEGELVLRGTFGEDQANFEWKVRAVVLPNGTDVDRLVEDQGRKAPGSIWVLEARIRIEAV